MNPKAVLARNLRVALSMREMSPRELSDETGISTPTISRAMNGKYEIGSHRLYLIAKKLNYPMEFFYSESISVFGDGMK